jgi:hypothetical protein
MFERNSKPGLFRFESQQLFGSITQELVAEINQGFIGALHDRELGNCYLHGKVRQRWKKNLRGSETVISLEDMDWLIDSEEKFKDGKTRSFGCLGSRSRRCRFRPFTRSLICKCLKQQVVSLCFLLFSRDHICRMSGEAGRNVEDAIA